MRPILAVLAQAAIWLAAPLFASLTAPPEPTVVTATNAGEERAVPNVCSRPTAVEPRNASLVNVAESNAPTQTIVGLDRAARAEAVSTPPTLAYEDLVPMVPPVRATKSVKEASVYQRAWAEYAPLSAFRPKIAS